MVGSFVFHLIQEKESAPHNLLDSFFRPFPLLIDNPVGSDLLWVSSEASLDSGGMDLKINSQNVYPMFSIQWVTNH